MKYYTKTIAENLLKNMGERNITDLVNLFDKEPDWEIPGNTEQISWLGVRNKKSEIENFYQLLWENTKPISADVENILIDKNRAVIIGKFKTLMLPTNKTVESFFCIYFETEKNLIKKYRLFENSFAVSKAMQFNEEY